MAEPGLIPTGAGGGVGDGGGQVVAMLRQRGRAVQVMAHPMETPMMNVQVHRVTCAVPSLGLERPNGPRPRDRGPGPGVAAPKGATGWQIIQREDLRRELLAGSVVLLEALSVNEYRSAHLPGALNVPGRLGRRNARALVRDKATQVVVYGAGAGSEQAQRLVARLGALGYSNVHLFSGGKGEWVRFLLPMEYWGRRLFGPEHRCRERAAG